jgi:aspartate/methionine/tyrosine aminotransferase
MNATLATVARIRACRRRASTSRASILSPAVTALVPSGIRAIMEMATTMGGDIIHLEVGQPSFSTPDHIVQATIASLNNGQTAYIGNSGIPELRSAIAARYNKTFPSSSTAKENVLVTAGSMMSLYSLILAILKPGDECLIPFPGFPNYQQSISLVGATSVAYTCLSEDQYLPTIAEIERRISSKTKCILLCNPGNPTGCNFPRELIGSILSLAKSRGIYVISDEIYSAITYENKHISVMEFEGSAPDTSTVAVISGVSKAYSMTGFRVGWTRASKDLVTSLSKLQEPIISCGVPFSQWAALAAITGPDDCVVNMTAAYRERRDVALAVLKERGRESRYVPGGAFYLPLDISSARMPSDKFAIELLRTKRVAVAPGTAFDTSSLDIFSGGVTELEFEKRKQLLRSFCRISLANDTELVRVGINRICDFLDENFEEMPTKRIYVPEDLKNSTTSTSYPRR